MLTTERKTRITIAVMAVIVMTIMAGCGPSKRNLAYAVHDMYNHGVLGVGYAENLISVYLRMERVYRNAAIFNDTESLANHEREIGALKKVYPEIIDKLHILSTMMVTKIALDTLKEKLDGYVAEGDKFMELAKTAEAADQKTIVEGLRAVSVLGDMVEKDANAVLQLFQARAKKLSDEMP